MIPRAPSSTLFPYTTLFRSYCGKHWRGINDGRGNRAAHGSDAAKAQHPGDSGDEQADGNEDQVVRYENSRVDRKSTRLNSSHLVNSYAVFCLKKKNKDSATD